MTDIVDELTTRWQPIETAPKDGTRALVFVPRYGAMSGHFSENKWHCHSAINRDAQPTYWMHLPDAPKEKDND
jgi:hypothetical protein